MFEHVTSFIEDIERVGFGKAGSLAEPLTQAMNDPDIVDKGYRDTADYAEVTARAPLCSSEVLDACMHCEILCILGTC